MILDAVKNHVIPHISKNYRTMRKGMFDSLVSFYQSENINRKMISRNKLRSIAVGETDADVELVNMALNGFLTSWESFIKGIWAWEKLPNFKRFWEPYIHEETQMESKASKKGSDINLSLIGQAKKGGGKGPSKVKGESEESASQPGKKEIMHHTV